MKIACLGGGPGGLYFAISMKIRRPEAEITVFERNRSDDTFGWGVVLSDQTLGNLQANDPVSAGMIRDHFAYWGDLAIVIDGERVVSGGHGFCGIGRKRLLLLLQERARDLGVDLRFATEVASADDLSGDYDVVVACDGLNSRTRARHEDVFRPLTDIRACKFMWLGTTQKFDDAFTFIFERTDKGWLWAHAYQFDADTATFIVECSEETFAAYGFGELSQQGSIKMLQEVFADHLGGHPLMTNATHIRGSAWINFPRVLCDRWSYKNIVLMGDAAATAHFSIGSGTKLALESAISLAALIDEEASLEVAFSRYEEDRRAQVLRIQSAALNSLEWFEQIERYLDFHPVQLNYAQLTRSQRISHENLRLRDPAWLEGAERWFQTQGGAPADAPIRPPVYAPLSLRGLTLPSRVAVDGNASGEVPAETGLLIAPPLDVTLTDVPVLAQITVPCAARLAYPGPHPVDRRQIGASALPWFVVSASEPKTDADMAIVTHAFVAAAKRAQLAGFDAVEIDAAGGGLLASFLSPATNRRTDGYGGDVASRLRFPLSVVTAVRRVWEGPLLVRITADDRLPEGGQTPDDSVEIARALAKAGADLLIVTGGGTLTTSGVGQGRMHGVPLSDRIRNEARVPTLALGGITDIDQANSILLAGRADLVALDAVAPVVRPEAAAPLRASQSVA